MNFVASGRKWFSGEETKQFDRKRIVDTLRIKWCRLAKPANYLASVEQKAVRNAG